MGWLRKRRIAHFLILGQVAILTMWEGDHDELPSSASWTG
jgi:hypothetical protein